MSCNCCNYYPSVSLYHRFFITLPSRDFSLHRSACQSAISNKKISLPFTVAWCENRSPIVSRDTSFKSSKWLIKFVYEAIIHCQTLTDERAEFFNLFAKVNTGPDVHTNAQKPTHNNAAPRGLGHPADSILLLLNASCVTKDNLASPGPGYLRGIWVVPCLTCGLRFLCFVLENVSLSLSLPASLLPSLPHTSLSLSLKWSAEGVLGTWLVAPLRGPPITVPSGWTP